MWARDYENALLAYSDFLESSKHMPEPIDALSMYRINFELTVASAILRKSDFEKVYHEKVKQTFSKIWKILETVRKKESNIREIRSAISESINREEKEQLLRKYFPNDDDTIAFLISPTYAKRFLKNALRNARMTEIPKVFEVSPFRYTLDFDLYRTVARVYSVQELRLDLLKNLQDIKQQISSPNTCYIEDESLRTSAAVKREGLIFCHYLLQSSYDASGATQIQAFLQKLSQVLFPRHNQ